MPWETLGIPPTTDAAVIRRAYVALLKGMDVDREPAAFIRLRQAYEYALAACSTQGTSTCGFALADADAPATVYLEWNDREAVDAEPDPYTVLERLLADHRAGDAWRAYNGLMASGAIGLDDQRPLAALVVTAALQDAGVTMDTLRAMVALLGPEEIVPDHLTDLRKEAAAKIAAHRWLDAVTHDATRWAIGPRRHAVLAARSFVGRRRRVGRSFRKLETINALLNEYNAHAGRLAGRVDERRLTDLKARAEQAVKRKQRRDAIFVCAVLVFVVVNVVYWNFFDR